MRAGLVSFLALVLAGCAGRSADPVSVVRPYDERLSCGAIKAEISQNNREIERISNERGWKFAQNVGAGIGAIVFFPAVVLMDLQGTQGIELQALNNRQHRLADLASYRCK